MHSALQEIFDKQFPDRVISKEDMPLFEAISKAFSELSEQNKKADREHQQDEGSAISSLDRALADALKRLNQDEASPTDEKTSLRQLVDRADQINELISQKTRIEQQLRNEIRHLKSIQKIAKAGSWEVDLTKPLGSQQHYWSEELLNLLDIEPDSVELNYHTYLNLIHPDDRGLFELAVNRAVTSRGTYDIEYRVIWKNGTVRFVRDVGHVLVDENSGTASKMVGITFDITETKETEHALSRTTKELQTLFNNMEEVFWSADLVQHKVLQMSPACKQVYGYEPEEMKQDPDLWFKVIVDEDKVIFTNDESLLRNGQTTRYEYRIRHKDGRIRWLEARITPTLNIEGKMIRLDGVNSDITARKEAETALKNSELRFRSLIQNSNDAITIADDNLRFTFVSESMTAMTGFSAEEILHTSILDYIHPAHHASVQEMLLPLSAHPGKPVYFEFQFLTKIGDWIWTEGYVTNLLQEESVGGYVANFRDITERKDYERSLEVSNEKLKKTNNELDRFVYSVSHDLRAPLASVLGLLEYSQTETEDKDMLMNLDMMKESIEKLDIFILDILDYSRNARIEVKKQKVDFHTLLSDVNNNLKFMSLGKSNVQMKINIQENGDFYSDRGRITVILNNLISNAMRYCNPECPDPYVEVEVSYDSEGAYLTVRDNGIGVDEKHHQKIFEMFFRVSNKSTGSGLGLYLVKETIDKLGGKLEFSSEPGSGTEFNIFLPNLAEKHD